MHAMKLLNKKPSSKRPKTVGQASARVAINFKSTSTIEHFPFASVLSVKGHGASGSYRTAAKPRDPRFGAALQKLSAMQSLQDGWDSYHAEAPSLRAIAEATAFVERLFAMGMYPARVVPSVIGGVGITLKRDAADRRAYVEFRNDGGIYYLLSDGIAAPIISPVELGRLGFQHAIRKIEDYLDASQVTPPFASWISSIEAPIGLAGRCRLLTE